MKRKISGSICSPPFHMCTAFGLANVWRRRRRAAYALRVGIRQAGPVQGMDTVRMHTLGGHKLHNMMIFVWKIFEIWNLETFWVLLFWDSWTPQ